MSEDGLVPVSFGPPPGPCAPRLALIGRGGSAREGLDRPPRADPREHNLPWADESILDGAPPPRSGRGGPAGDAASGRAASRCSSPRIGTSSTAARAAAPSSGSDRHGNGSGGAAPRTRGGTSTARTRRSGGTRAGKAAVLARVVTQIPRLRPGYCAAGPGVTRWPGRPCSASRASAPKNAATRFAPPRTARGSGSCAASRRGGRSAAGSSSGAAGSRESARGASRRNGAAASNATGGGRHDAPFVHHPWRSLPTSRRCRRRIR